MSEFSLKQFLLLITKSRSESIYWECSGNIFSFLKYSLRVSTSKSRNDSNGPFLQSEDSGTIV